MVRFRWVGVLQEIGCSDFQRENKYEIRTPKNISFDQVFFLCCVYLIFVNNTMVK